MCSTFNMQITKLRPRPNPAPVRLRNTAIDRGRVTKWLTWQVFVCPDKQCVSILGPVLRSYFGSLGSLYKDDKQNCLDRQDCRALIYRSSPLKMYGTVQILRQTSVSAQCFHFLTNWRPGFVAVGQRYNPLLEVYIVTRPR